MTWRLAGYTEIGRIGSGATGTVVSARHEPTGTFVAIKFLSARKYGRSTPSSWFRSQVKVLADIDSPNVVRLHEYIEGSRGGALVMELVDGVSLDELIARGPLEPQAALAVLRGSLRAFAATHAKDVLHRDFRPGNVQISRGGSVKVVDFGVVPPVDSMRPSVGTPLYQAPELWDRQPADARTDIYAATATFVECLTGKPPFPPANTMAEMRTAHEEGPIPVDDIPEPLRDLVTRGLAKDPANRPADAVSFLKSVEHVAAMRYGSDWERAGEAALVRRLVPLVPPPSGAPEMTTRRAAAAVVGSTLATRLLAGAAMAAAIVIAVSSGIDATGSSINTTSADQPEFAVVLPGASSGGPSGSPTAIPTLLIIPTPGVTLTAPPVRTTGPPRGGGVVIPVPAPPPPTHTVKPTGTTKPPGGGTTPPPTTVIPTTNPPPTDTTTPTPVPPVIQSATFDSMTSDGTNITFSFDVTASAGDGTTPIVVSLSENGGGAFFSQTFDVPGGTNTFSGTATAVPTYLCTDGVVLAISSDIGGLSGSLPTGC
jgi:serine/threonine-protein kinase